MTAQEIPPAGMSIRLESGSASDRGLRRELNEDALLAAEPIFAVADGMGGHEAGEVASGICVRTLRDSGIPGSLRVDLSAEGLQELISQADRNIREATGGNAGTTLTGVVMVEEAGHPYWLFFNVGDSRTYRLRHGELAQVTVDHSEVQELVDDGRITAAQAHVHPRRHVVTRALGTGPDTGADFWLIPVEPGDRILACSDGLTGEVSEEGIAEILQGVADPADAADALVQAALRAGGRDNISVVVVDARDTRSPSRRAQGAGAPARHASTEDTLPRRSAVAPDDAGTDGARTDGARTDGAPGTENEGQLP